VQRDASPPSALFSFYLKHNVYKCTKPLLAAKFARTPVKNLEPCDVTLARYCYAESNRMEVQHISLYHVSHLQCYGVMVHGNVTSVYPP
jgi:hypothetical protein